MLERVGSFEERLTETRDIARDNQKRLERVEERLALLEEIALENRNMILENRDLILENRRILLAIADHLDLTMEIRPPGSSVWLSESHIVSASAASAAHGHNNATRHLAHLP